MCALSPLPLYNKLAHSFWWTSDVTGWNTSLVTDSVIYVSSKTILFYERPFYVEANASVSTHYVTTKCMCWSFANTRVLSCCWKSPTNLKGTCEMLNNHAATLSQCYGTRTRPSGIRCRVFWLNLPKLLRKKKKTTWTLMESLQPCRKRQ
jgi:hypothetical protein